MNETVKIILSRKSINTFSDQLISKQDLETLLKAGMAAPSGGDIRPWRFIVITNKETLSEISVALNATEKIKGNTATIIILGDSSQSERFWTFDCSLAAENIIITAQSFGIGSHWVSIRPNEERIDNIKKLFDLPNTIEPLCAIVLGFPKQDINPKDKFDLTNIHWEKW